MLWYQYLTVMKVFHWFSRALVKVSVLEMLLILASQSIYDELSNSSLVDRMDRKRSRLETIYTILTLALSGIRKTHIMYRANLSHQQLNKYLNLLLEKELLEIQENRYFTTQRGHAFRTTFEDLQIILSEDHTLDIPNPNYNLRL